MSDTTNTTAAVTQVETRIIHRHDTPDRWKDSSLIPMRGELIIYDNRDSDGKLIKDEDGNEIEGAAIRYKIGDGVTPVNKLSFVGSSIAVGSIEPGMDTDKEIWIDTGEGDPTQIDISSFNNNEDYVNAIIIKGETADKDTAVMGIEYNSTDSANNRGIQLAAGDNIALSADEMGVITIDANIPAQPELTYQSTSIPNGAAIKSLLFSFDENTGTLDIQITPETLI